jgi:hypothetical protein
MLSSSKVLQTRFLFVGFSLVAVGIVSLREITLLAGISVASFCQVLWKAIRAINKNTSKILLIKFPANCDDARDVALGFQPISQQQGCTLWNCFAVLDGYHLQIQTLTKTEARNLRSLTLPDPWGKCLSGV